MYNFDQFKHLEYLVIVSYYDADISWTSKIKLPYQIYYKNKPEKEPFNAENKAKSETNICKFLYQFYDHLPQNIIFVHQYEYKWYHRGSLSDLLNNPGLLEYYQNSKTPGYATINCKPLGDIKPQIRKMVESGWWGNTMSKYFGNILNYHNFTKNKGACAQFIVSRERVRSLSKKFYENMYHWLVNNSIGDTNIGINPISKMRVITPIDNHILSHYHTARYMEWSYELIFTTYKKWENDYYKFKINKSRLVEVDIVEEAEEALEEVEEAEEALEEDNLYLKIENVEDNNNNKRLEEYSEEIELLALYGYDKYYVNVSKLFYQNFIRDNRVIIDKNVNFNEVFADYLTGSYKNLKLDINKKIKITIMEKRSQDFTYDL